MNYSYPRLVWCEESAQIIDKTGFVGTLLARGRTNIDADAL